MLQFNVQSLLDREGKTRYWLVKQMGTDYATVNKICDNASKSVRIDTLERLMKARDCAAVSRSFHLRPAAPKTRWISPKKKPARRV